MQYQNINEVLAKGIKVENMSPDLKKEISMANKYLLNRKGSKPEWMDDFLDSNRCKLVETICRATSVAQGISSLQGYSEGYFNEIIQNANDLHCGDTINIAVEIKEQKINLECQYADKGFNLSNIYAFLNREMSDKIEDDSQTGKFGVGIKSFFKFVDELSIISNVWFAFSIDRMGNDNNVTGETRINTDWSDKKTSLMISYDPDIERGFNTRKLTELIEYLCGSTNIDVLNCFLTGKDSEMVFDIRSLLFMKLNSKSKQSISKLFFKGSTHSINICCSEKVKISTVNAEDEDWKTGVLSLKLDVDQKTRYENEYIVFSNKDISAAFPVFDHSTEENRMYATYYLKTDTKFLPMGMLLNSKYANIHRNDIGNNEEEINIVYEKLREYMKRLYEFMCSEEAASLPCADDVSDVFHNIIARYLTVDIQNYPETPLDEAYFDNSFLPKRKKEKAKIYVINHKDKEAYDSVSYQEGDIRQELRENYFKFVEKTNTYDLMELIRDQDCIAGVHEVYSLLSGEDNEIPLQNWRTAVRITNYYSSVGEFLVSEIAQERKDELSVSDAEIDNWLLRLKEEVGINFNAKMFLKLVGRYKLNEAIAYDGSICYAKLSFKDYLFNGMLVSSDGLLSQYQNQFYDEKYSNLKRELLQRRYQDNGNKNNTYMIRFTQPTGPSSRNWDKIYELCEMPQYTDFGGLSEPLLLLEQMAEDKKFTDSILFPSSKEAMSSPSLFENGKIRLRHRNYLFEHCKVYGQQIINLSCIQSIELRSFVDFTNALKYRRKLTDEQLRRYIHISCIEESISTRDIVENILPVMVETPEGNNKEYLLNEFSPSDIQIKNIWENSNNEMPDENAKFVFKITGYRVHIYRFVSKTKHKILAYFGDGKCAVKTGASKEFKEVAKFSAKDNHVYIFYDNISGDLQQAVAGVLDEIGVGTKELGLLEGYIHNGNTTKTMSYISRRRNLAKVKKKLLLEWTDFNQGDLSQISDTEILYRLLTARGSYDIFCPICSDIPLEIFDYGEDTKKKHSRKIILMENENPETNAEVPYIITVACAYCSQRLRSTLVKSEFDGKNIVLTTQIAHGLHEKTKSKQQIELSPVNIEVMKRFKL